MVSQGRIEIPVDLLVEALVNGPMIRLGLKDLRWSVTPWAGGGNNSSAAVQLADAAVCGGYADYVVAFRSLAQGQFYRLGSAFSVLRGLRAAVANPARYSADFWRRWASSP